MGVLDDFIANDYVRSKIEQSSETQFSCIEAEESVLRRMMVSQDVAEDVLQELTSADFSGDEYGKVFGAIENVVKSERRVDAITVGEAAGRLFPQSSRKLREIIVVLTKYKEPTIDDSRDIRDHVAIVKSLARRRRASQRIGELMRDIQDPSKDIDETLIKIRDAVDNSGVDNGNGTPLMEVLMRTYEYAEKRSKGEIKAITSGLKNLDNLIGGFYGGEFTVIGARPSVGKSAFAQFIAVKAAMNGYKVGIVSCEMVDIGYGQRIYSYLANMDSMDIRKGEVDDSGWEKLTDAMVYAENLGIEFWFDSTYIEDVVNWATKKARRGEMDMLIVDYLQLMDTRKHFDSEHLRVGYISRMLKRLSVKLNIPVIAAAQVNRETDGSMPTLKHLKDSGSIEQDCDGVIFLHNIKNDNDPLYNPMDVGNLPQFIEDGNRYMCLSVAKQRQGSTGLISLAYRPQTTSFSPFDRSRE